MSDIGPEHRVSDHHVRSVLRRLEEQYGRPRWVDRSHDSPLDELIQTILSQHTSDLNSGRAFQQLTTRFDDWEAVAAASRADVSDAIRCGGLAEQKARTIQQVLQDVLSEDGGTPLGELDALPLDQAKARLTSLPGVGPKTAACVLLFACGRPALPVDTHVYRVARRVGLITEDVSPERAHDNLEALLAPEDVYSFHLSMITHGRLVCLARAPRCDRCPLLGLCRFGGRASSDPPAAASGTVASVASTAGTPS